MTAKSNRLMFLASLTSGFAAVLWAPMIVRAHCDTMDGPVVTAARQALEKGDITPVLKWVKKEHEPQIREAFRKTLAVRAKGAEARELADMYFFETLVRIHRAGEGEPYTGIKPAGRDLGPAVPAADRAIADGKLEPLYKILVNKIHEGLHEKFEAVMKKKDFKKDQVDAGREFVEAYVPFVHYVEALYDAAAKGGGHGIAHDAEKEGGHRH